MNEKNGDPAFGVTPFSDLTPKEFRQQYLMSKKLKMPKAPLVDVPKKMPNIPTSYDWRNVTPLCVTPVKNQQQCGSCWAFSATETIESVWARANHTLAVLAPQQIVDCDKYDSGCDGGWPYNAYKYVIQAGGLESEKDYPYKAVDQKCDFKKADVVAKLTNWKYVNQQPSGENTTMLNYVYTTSPVSICVDASTWQYYTSGVLTTCGDSIDHCVQITGFTEMLDKKRNINVPVWIIRNSWGTSWGVEGYIFVERGKNLCELATVVTVPVAA
jgi:cathepsin F